LIYSSIGDRPEKLVYRKVNIENSDWSSGQAGPENKLFVPELNWEGANQVREEPEEGSPIKLVHQLRDPSIFRNNDGKIYLLYSGTGENGIGIAELEI
jgi:hypothetical protein|tara:strand:+ start:3435 stop:3728 length:294 start_codon:yes stop_codon:yes gene_type:complete